MLRPSLLLAAPLALLLVACGGDKPADSGSPTTTSAGTPCVDTDGDRVCDEDDACEGFNDNADIDQDGTPDGCDPCPDDPTDDSDGDGSCDSADLCQGDDATGDTDGDGVCDDTDPCPADLNDDSDGDGSCDGADVCTGDDTSGDTDGDGVCDDTDPCPVDDPDDSDGDTVCDADDVCDGYDDRVDGDGDGTPDDCDLCPVDPLDDSDADGVCDSADICLGLDAAGDPDGDGVCNDIDPCPDDNPDDSDGDGSCDSFDVCTGDDRTGDRDLDGVCNDVDPCPQDPNDDSDNDGSCDSADLCTGNDTSGDTDGDGVCDDTDPCPVDNPDDSDGDGSCDANDLCTGDDRTGDTDGDGACDDTDPCPADNPDDADGDGVCESVDACVGNDASGDTDGDGVCDDIDPCPVDALDDSDSDGSCDSVDLCTGDDRTGDPDGDGVCSDIDPCPADFLDDSDNDGSCDSADLCFGNDASGNTDGDGTCDDLDPCPLDRFDDSDGDGSCDSADLCTGNDTTGDTDLDGVCDDIDPCPIDVNDDSDNDGSCDSVDLCVGDDVSGDTDGDGVCDDTDPCPIDVNDDSDNDGSCDSVDLCVGDDATGDADRDGYCLDADICDDRYNPGQEDVCNVWFVDDDAPVGGDGTSWGTAFDHVDDALAAAVSGDELWIAEGRYTPRAAATDFLVANGQKFYGGFAGNEMTLADRAGLFHETVISGDLQGNDDGTAATMTDNAIHVFNVSGTVGIDGLVIADGNQTGVFGGAGVFVNANATANLRNCVVRDNRDNRSGAGIDYRSASGGTIENCVFLRNFANQGAAAIQAGVNDTLTIRNTTIIDSVSGNLGTAAAIQQAALGSVLLDNVAISGTDAQPAIWHGTGMVMEIRNTTIYGHSSAIQDDPLDAVITNTCANQDLSSWSGTNVFLDDTTAELGDPYVAWGYRLFLADASSGDGFTSACVDAGSDVDADVALPDWFNLSTRTDGLEDATPVDPSAHYALDGSLCLGDDASGDSDGDRLCDELDPCPVDSPDDPDGDGVCTSDDICIGFDDTVDNDNDGVPDGCDLCWGDDSTGDRDADLLCADQEAALGTSDAVWDFDGDLLGDGEEVTVWGTDPKDADTDGGGTFDGHEVVLGTDPAVTPGDDSVAGTVFVTSSVLSSDLGGMGGADQLCKDHASAAGLAGAYAAFLSTSAGGNARDRVLDASYINPNLEIVANNLADLTDGGLDASVRYDEAGAAVTTDLQVWTGSTVGGTFDAGGADCGGWTGSQQLQLVTVGNATASTASWVDNGSQPCAGAARLYCFQVGP